MEFAPKRGSTLLYGSKVTKKYGPNGPGQSLKLTTNNSFALTK